MTVEKTFMLDEKVIVFRTGDTIMAAAKRAGHYIPHLCYHPDYPPHGSCRLCSVRVGKRLVSACTWPATERAASGERNR